MVRRKIEKLKVERLVFISSNIYNFLHICFLLQFLWWFSLRATGPVLIWMGQSTMFVG